MTSTKSSPTTEFCRICHDLSRQSPLINPCHCSGSISWVHLRCLEYWLSQSRTEQCELCRFHYECRLQYPSIFQYILKFHHTLIVEFLLFSIFTPMELLIVFLTLNGAILQIGAGHTLESIVLILLFLFLAAVYLLWLALSARATYRHFRQWQKLNPSVKLHLQLPGKFVSHANQTDCPSSSSASSSSSSASVMFSNQSDLNAIASSNDSIVDLTNLTTNTDLSITLTSSPSSESQLPNNLSTSFCHNHNHHHLPSHISLTSLLCDLSLVKLESNADRIAANKPMENTELFDSSIQSKFNSITTSLDQTPPNLT